MSIRWIRNVVVDGEKTALEIQLGEKRIGDKCYTRLGGEVERWFNNTGIEREDIIRQGMEILKRRLAGKSVTYPDEREFDWG